jgi:pimeloyl-ACP methyl ester carboxylesterase
MVKDAVSHLAYEVYYSTQNISPAGKYSILFMHGILGNKKNFRTAAKQIVNNRYKLDVSISVDHRGHGSSPFPPSILGSAENTVYSCSEDILYFLSNGPIRLVNNTPSILCGHSFGGKVALMYLQKCVEQGLQPPNDIWILDSLPGPYDLSMDEKQGPDHSVIKVLNTVQNLIDGGAGDIFRDRATATAGLQSSGLSSPMALWLASSLVPVDESGSSRVRFCFDIATVIELFEDFCRLDMWSFLDSFANRQERSSFL